MTTYAGRYGSGPQIKPGGMAMALVATVLPLAGLIAGLQIRNIIHPPKDPRLIKIEETKKPPPEPLKKVPPKPLSNEKIVVPPIPLPPIPTLPPIDLTPVKPMDPPGGDVIGRVPEPTPPAPIEPIKAPVIVGVQIASMAALQPPYPAEEQRAGREGRVTLRVLVGADGRVKQVEKVAATSDAFYTATEKQALGRWRFKPATRDGVPFEQWKTMSVRFVLDGE